MIFPVVVSDVLISCVVSVEVVEDFAGSKQHNITRDRKTNVCSFIFRSLGIIIRLLFGMNE